MMVRIALLGLWFLATSAAARVFINEVHWAGSDLRTADEWIELFGLDGSTNVSLWTLTTVSSNGQETIMHTFGSGVMIQSGHYLIISNYPEAESRLSFQPDIVTTAVSLPNSKLMLRLRDQNGQIMDLADDGIGIPFAGSNPSGSDGKASMERISYSDGSQKEAWRTATDSRGFDPGVLIFGTPGTRNSQHLSSVSSISSSVASSSSESLSSSSSESSLSSDSSGSSVGSGTSISSISEDSSDSSIAPISSESSHSSNSFVSSSTGSSLSSLPAVASSEAQVGASASSSGSSISSEVSDSSSTSISSLSSGSSDSSLPAVASSEAQVGVSLAPPKSAGADEGGSISSQPLPEPNIFTPIIRITEVLANPIGADTNEWIEIGNIGSGSVDITGWILDEGNSPASYVIPGSGAVLEPGQHRSFRKSVTSLPLDNQGETLSLKSGTGVIDTWAYLETAEEVSYGRVLTGTGFSAFCVPTEGKPNIDLALDPQIHLQTGSFEGNGKTTVNVEAFAQTGSLASATCHFDFGDGHLSDSCNPPSHAYTTAGSFLLRLTVNTYCGNTVERTASVLVLEKGRAVPKSEAKGQTHSGTVTPVFSSICVSPVTSGVRISEVLPNPFGDEEASEWVELENLTGEQIPLCGWILDDDDGGSDPYPLEGTLQARGFIVFPRSVTKIAFNNDVDIVQLKNPFGTVISSEKIWKAPEGEALAFRKDGNYVWTPFLTPGAENRFRTAERRFPSDRVIVSAALPNPVGKDKDHEWIELSNMSDEDFILNDWFLDNKDGGSKPFSLKGVNLLAGETRRFSVMESKLQLVNTFDAARLLDPDGNVASILSWTEAGEGRIYRPYAFSAERMKARVVRVVDGDTFDIILTDLDHLDRIPESIRRRWLGVEESSDPTIRVRMLGIDTPETVHPLLPIQQYGIEASNFVRSLIEEKEIELEFDTELWDKYGRLLAYVYVQGSSVQAEILRNGLGYAYLRFPFIRASEYIAYQEEARRAKLGLWNNPESESYVLSLQEGLSAFIDVQDIGLDIDVDPRAGRVSSGTLVTFVPSQPAKLFLSLNSGSFVRFSGSYIVMESVLLRAYAEINDIEGGTGSLLRSEMVEVSYSIPRTKYGTGFIISEIYPAPFTPATFSSPSTPDTRLPSPFTPDAGSLSSFTPDAGPPSPSAEGEGRDEGSSASNDSPPVPPRILEQEWIELFNPTDEDISLLEWTLDDVRGSGSKPIMIKEDRIIPARGFFVLNLSGSKLALNNDGDDVWLVGPDEKFAVGITYPKVKKGQAYASSGSGAAFCVTDIATPGTENRCVIAAKKTAAKKAAAKVKKPKKTTKNSAKKSGMIALRTKYENVVQRSEEENVAEASEQFLRLQAAALKSVIPETSTGTILKLELEIVLMASVTLGSFLLLKTAGKG